MTHARSLSRGMVMGFFVALLAVLLGVPAGVLQGADHRESPLAGEDPAADIADVFVFRSPTDATKVIFAMTVNGFSVPAVRGGYSFSPDVLYQFKIDNTGDGREDLVLQVTFEGFEPVRDSRCLPPAAGGQFVEVIGPAKPKDTGADNHLLRKGPEVEGCTNTVLGPNAQGIRAFAGLADDPFVVDIGQLNRILGGAQEVFRDAPGTPVLGDLRGRPLRADGTSGVDGFGGFNVSAIVLEVPIALVQGSARRTSTYLANDTTIGVWGTTSRSKARILSTRRDPRDAGPYIQVQRAGHQVFKTIFIPASERDAFNRSTPTTDAARFGQFIPDALTTTDNDGTGNTIAGRAAVLDAIGFTALPGGASLALPPDFGNTDKNLLRKVLLPDVLRLDLALAPPNDFVVANNGLQNGRRFGDDVIDILLRLGRQLIDVQFPPGSGVPGSGALGSRRALNCSALPCPDRRVLAVLQGTDFLEADDDAIEDLSNSGNERPLRPDFPFIPTPHPLPGNPGTVGFPAL